MVVGTERSPFEGRRNGSERRFGSALAGGEPEIPVGDVAAAAEPLVRPGENEDARASRLERCLDLPPERLRLTVFPVAPAVQTDFGHDQRPFSGEILETGEVRRELVPALQVHVESDKIQ